MRIHVYFSAVVLLAMGHPVSAYAAGGCAPVTVCDHYKNPPVCTTTIVCTIVPPPDAEVAGTQVPEGQGYSIELKGLNKGQLKKLLDQLGADKSKIEVPQ
jgi:hypothetical protein